MKNSLLALLILLLTHNLTIAQNCVGDAGILSIAKGDSYSNLDYICADSCITVAAINSILADSTALTIVLHTDGEITVSNFPPKSILAYGNMFCNEEGKKQRIYATAFGVTTNVNGEPDFNDECITYSNTIEANFLSPVNLITDLICDDSTGLYEVCFTINGGFTDYFPASKLLVIGDDRHHLLNINQL